MLEDQTNATHHITEADRVALERGYEQLVVRKNSNKEKEEIFDADPIHNYKCVEILAFFEYVDHPCFSEQFVIQNQELQNRCGIHLEAYLFRNVARLSCMRYFL